MALARERFALAIMGVHFAEARMFDLISYARASALNREVPIVCFLNLTAIADDEAGNALVRGMLGEYLHPLLPERTLQQIKPSST